MPKINAAGHVTHEAAGVDEYVNVVVTQARKQDADVASSDTEHVDARDDTDEGVEVVTEDLETYDDLNKTELKAEIDRRNEDRDDDDKIQVASKASKEELVGALEQDDEDNDAEEVEED